MTPVRSNNMMQSYAVHFKLYFTKGRQKLQLFFRGHQWCLEMCHTFGKIVQNCLCCDLVTNMSQSLLSLLTKTKGGSFTLGVSQQKYSLQITSLSLCVPATLYLPIVSFLPVCPWSLFSPVNSAQVRSHSGKTDHRPLAIQAFQALCKLKL